MPVFIFLQWRHVWQTIKIGANFLRNSLLHKIKRIFVSGQVFRQFSWKLVQNEKDYSLTLKFQNFCEILGGRCETIAPLRHHILRWWRQNIGLEFQDLMKIVSWTNTSPQSSIYFWLSSFYHNWYMKHEFASFFEPILGWWCHHHLSENFKNLKERSHKWIIHLKIPFPFDFHLSINNDTWNTNFGPFRPIFGLMTSPWEVETSKFRERGFKNEYFTSNFPLLSTYVFLTLLVHEIQVLTLFDTILGYWHHLGSQNCNVLRKWSHKETPHFKFPLNNDFNLFITLNTWYNTLVPLYLICR